MGPPRLPVLLVRGGVEPVSRSVAMDYDTLRGRESRQDAPEQELADDYERNEH